MGSKTSDCIARSFEYWRSITSWNKWWCLGAIDVALMREDLVYKVVVDSFDGRRFADDFAEQLQEKRKLYKLDVYA